MAIGTDMVESLRSKLGAVLPHLDERQQRLVMAAEARSLGHGGIAAVATATGTSRSRISQGVAELEAGVAPLGRARGTGGGRKSLTETDPELVAALLALVEPTRHGIPESALCWTTLSTRNLAAELTAGGHKVGPDTVAKLLREQSFSLHRNSKAFAGKRYPGRNEQFSYINDQAAEHLASGDPVIGVDVKKEAPTSRYTERGRQWCPAGGPGTVEVHDPVDRERSNASSSGVHDLAFDTGRVSVRTDHDTAAFAVQSIRHWWLTLGTNTWPTATRLLITADGGGSNGYGTCLWEAELAALAEQLGLTITSCHFPPGTSKWNEIEHRLFFHVSMTRRGRPVTSHEAIVRAIAGTGTRSDPTAHGQLDTGKPPRQKLGPGNTMTPRPNPARG